ncbi:MAG: hypothetical protein KDA89_13145 [Planctomycetaceae bacterium]|nr:hypothetical protein [Planctomycetaceae bacterium]
MNRYPITISAVVPGIILAGIMQFSAMPIFASESGPGSNSDRKVATEDAFRKDVLPIVQKYCADCHGDSEPDGGVSLHDLTQADQVTENRDTWVRAYRLLGIDGMPPKDHDVRLTNANEWCSGWT